MSTTTTLQAIATHLTAEWITTYAWEESRLQARPPMATLWLAELEPGRTDQGAPLGPWAVIRVTIRVYVNATQREKAAQQQLADTIDELATVLVDDHTCDGAALTVTIADPIRFLVDTEDNLLIAETTLEVEPWPSA